jgi:pyruvate kinase
MQVSRATKIVATLGPASSDPQLLEQMVREGVNVVRLNFSHGKAQDHIDRATMVREAAQRAGREVAIMADLQGPKIRVGKFAEGKVMLEPGERFVLDASRTEPGDINGVGLDYKELPRDVKAGDVLLLNDGLIVLTVDAVRGEEVHTIVKLGGELSNNKGINKQGGGLTAPALTAKDMEDIKTAMSFQADYVAVSFPKNATDMEMARQLCNVAAAQYGHKPGLIAKIERAEAIPRLEEILGLRRHHGRPWRSGRGSGQCRRARAAKEDDPHGARHGQGGDHRDPDDGVHDHQPRAHPRRSERRGQCRAGRHRCRDAERRNRRRQVPAGDRA